MGIDKSLWDAYPSVIINGSKYHYGKTPEYGTYLVEHASYAKDYWSFKEEVDLRAFLTNLPGSADRDLHLKRHPDWREVTPEQRAAYREADKLVFRAMAAEKIANGTAHPYIMDLEGENGPYEPQQIPKADTGEKPVERVERKLREGVIPGGLSEAGKLRMIEGEIDWDGVTARDKEAILAREVDFKRITREQFDFVYEDIAHYKHEPADATVARKLFEEAQAGPQPPPQSGDDEYARQLESVRDTTRNLVEAIGFDAWPRNAAIIDFGLDSQQHYEALYYPIREGEISPAQLDAALGHGEKLTALVRKAPSNPHKDVTFHTSWDGLYGRPKPAGAVSEEEKLNRTLDGLGNQADVRGEKGRDEKLPSPSDIANDRGVAVGQDGDSQDRSRQHETDPSKKR